MSVAFLITVFDQLRETKFTVDMLRNKWESTKESPIVIVVTGDFDRELQYNDDEFTHVVHLDDIVGDMARSKVPQSIMRQIEHGMLEMKCLEEKHGKIDSIVHMHGDILLLNERGFMKELDAWRNTEYPILGDSVGPQGPYFLEKTLPGMHKDMHIVFYGYEMMPQLFVVDHDFCKKTGYMYKMNIVGDHEKVATEWALIGNIYRLTISDEELDIDTSVVTSSPYKDIFEKHVKVVKRGRSQWDIHRHFGGFCHFGNNINFTKEYREKMNAKALRAYGVDMAGW